MKVITKVSTLKEISEIKISYKRKTYFPDDTITCSLTGASILRKIYNKNTIELFECFVALFLDNRNKVIGYYTVGQGGYNYTLVESRLIFAIALQSGCVSIILSHNHPSGNIKPSQPDIDLTNKIVKGGELLGIKVLDHIIVTSTSHYSFMDNGLL